jgi:hypothetical protein
MPHLITVRLLFAPLAAIMLGPWVHAEPLQIETTMVDAEALHFVTFQSNNQKVVHNKRGIFMTYNRSRDEKYNGASCRARMEGRRSRRCMSPRPPRTRPRWKPTARIISTSAIPIG